MAATLFVIAVLMSAGTCLSDTKDVTKYSHECVVWANVTQMLDDEPNVVMECHKNVECSGLDCVGDYKYRGLLSSLVNLDTKFCFGMVVEPCTQPTAVQMYLDIFEDNTTVRETAITITNDTEVPVKGSDVNVMGNNAHGFLDIHMNHTDKHNEPHIYLSVYFKIKVKSNMFGFEVEQVLDDMQVAIIQGIYIPVPPCDPRVGNHTHKAGECSWKATYIVPSGTIIRTGSLRKCDSNANAFGSCDHREMCKLNQCVCMPDYVYDNNTKSCKRDLVKEVDTPKVTQTAGGVPKKTVLIVCSVAGVLILIAIATAVGIKLRKHRDRYRGRQLVFTEEEDDDPEVVA